MATDLALKFWKTVGDKEATRWERDAQTRNARKEFIRIELVIAKK